VTLTTTSCPCGRATPRGHTICPACAGHLAQLLRAVPELLRELDITIARLCSAREGLGSDGLPYDSAAGDASAHLTTLLITYGRRWLRTHPTDRPKSNVAHLMSTPTGLAVLMAGTSLAADIWADEMHQALTAAVQLATEVIDRPPERRFVGWCPGDDGAPCGAALYAPTGHAIIRCARCGATWDVEASRAALFAAADDVIADGATLARACGIPLPTMRSWRRRGHLLQATDPHGRPMCDGRGRPLYRLADVRRLADARRLAYAKSDGPGTSCEVPGPDRSC
jgi:hypothetical protein